jgi:peroxiredoxin
MKTSTLKPYFIGFFFLFLSNSCTDMPSATEGNTAPNFVLKNLQNQKIELSKYKGKVVMLHFWTDYCQACRVEFPRLEESYKALKSDKFEILAVNVGQSMAVSKDFQKSFDITFPLLTDTQKITEDLYNIEGFPTNYFIDPQGKVIRKFTGWVNKKQMEVIIHQHSKKNQP